MSLTPEQKDLLDSTIRRRVAVTTLKSLHRQIETDAREESAAQRSAGRALGIVLGVLALVVAYLVIRALFDQLQTGVRSTASLTSEASKIACYMALITGALAVAAYLCIDVRVSPLLFATVAVASITIVSVCVAALYFFVVPVSGCPDGWDSANRNDLDRALAELTTCLAFPRLTTAARAHALQTRGWVYYRRKEYASTIEALEAAFQVAPPKREGELMLYAVALRRTGRLDDSLRALAHAQELEAAGASSTIEQQRGLILAELELHEEAIAAFSRMLTLGEFTPQAYWWRGQSYEKIGKGTLAREDFEECVRLLSSKPHLPPELIDLLPKVRAKLDQSVATK